MGAEQKLTRSQSIPHIPSSTSQRINLSRETVPPAPDVKEGKVYDYSVGDLLTLAKSSNASDLHLRVGEVPILRINGKLVRTEGGPVLTPEATEKLIKGFTSQENLTRLTESGSADFALSFGDGERFRVHIFCERGQYGAVLRNIPSKIRTLEELQVPALVHKFLDLPRGLVLVVGPTGSGKSTTLAAMIQRIAATNDEAHIITLEDPIEYYYKHGKALTSQREVGIDVPSFSRGIRDALRANPTHILVGEMRDLETMEAALHAAETGHLVFATLHTTGAGRTVDRIVDGFPANQQENIRIKLASSVKGIVSQLLLPQTDATGTTVGKVAVFEVMISTPAIENHIRTKKTNAIADEIQQGGKNFGMVTLDSSLLDAFVAGKISKGLALSKALDRITLEGRIADLERRHS